MGSSPFDSMVDNLKPCSMLWPTAKVQYSIEECLDNGNPRDAVILACRVLNLLRHALCVFQTYSIKILTIYSMLNRFTLMYSRFLCTIDAECSHIGLCTH